MPHPIRLLGKTISFLEKTLRKRFSPTPRGELWGGALLVGMVCGMSVGVPALLLWAAGLIHPLLRLALESWIIYQLLATRNLRDMSMAVYRPLAAGELASARRAVGEIVGRDTAALDEAGIIRAAVETVAENSSDGVLAPLLYCAIGGAPLMALYKAINTMDSMVGYQNERYQHFGRVAARLDDVANYLPARLCGALMVAAAALGGGDARGAARILWRDHARHQSPNAAWPEAACAGALGLMLGGPSLYGGRVVQKPSIGDRLRPIAPLDIIRANRLLYITAFLGLVLLGGIRLLWVMTMGGMAI